MARSLYDVLELSQQASADAVRAAYERLSSKYDPDSPANQNNADARVQHIAVKEAFFRLGSPEKRKQYDLSLQAKTNSGYVEEIPPFWTLGKAMEC